jgi:CHAD domain-containing protein
LVAGLREEFPELNGESLHAYRKRLKKVRYLAEISAAADPLAERQATTLKRMQSAAGKWHDWQSLTEEVGRAFRGRNGSEGLAKLLEARAQESLQEALGLVQRATAQLLKREAKGVTSSRSH